ncbi:MAG: outer membrane lipoprotein-sorting protein [Planctomycetes bacterium]|nr:outer membrane lipoprotein-sorting protein [Planctomycetota bacterium]
MRYHITIIATLLFALSGNSSWAGDSAKEKAPDVDTIIKKANKVSYYQGKNGSAHVSMTIKDKDGQTRVRKLVILRMDEAAPKGENGAEANDDYCGEQKIYAYFTRPADVNRTAFLVWKHLDKDDDRWIYLPALDLKKRISSTDKRTSFVGTNFYYEDVSGRNIDADTHELIETTKDCYVIKNTPKDPASVEFASYTVWIHKTTFLPIQTEYYDKDGKAFRKYLALNVETIQGYPTVTKATMSDLRTGGETTAEYSDVKYDVELPEDIFTERYLRNAPTKYLR